MRATENFLLVMANDKCKLIVTSCSKGEVSTMNQLPYLLITAVLAALSFSPAVYGFAYAPNFITKIIEEQTGITPVGLLAVESETVAKNKNNGIVATLEQDSKELSSLGFDENNASNQRVVTTRFPPEPNGYLHLGHAKAISFNFQVARMFGGRCHMRLDDTNPSKESMEYVNSILEDVCWVQSGVDGPSSSLSAAAARNNVPWFGPVRKTSDYFDQTYQCAMALIEQGNAYVDELTADEMKEYRGTLTEPGKPSPYRERSIQENKDLFARMRAGEFADGSMVLRAKIDMASPNINMRDPTLYRIKHEDHQASGDAWCIYPMYDFSHPIADALEGITHSLCTLEFEDHRPFYDWTIDKLLPTGLLPSNGRPQQIEFSRLNIQSTVLSKRKLIKLVMEKVVNGWDDPRMPTLSGIRRRGVPPSALRLFCERIGISKADSNIAYTVLEDVVRDDMDDSCPRAFCVLEPLKVTITNWEDSKLEEFQVPRHPKRKEEGDRVVPFGKSLYIERSDFFDLQGPEAQLTGGQPPKGYKRLLPDDKVRLKYAYVIQCDEVVRNLQTQEPIELKCRVFPETRAGATPEGMARVKGIIHWVEASTAISCSVNQYDRLFLTDEPGKESGDFLLDINTDSLQVLKNVQLEPSVGTDALALIDAITEQSKDPNAGEFSTNKLYHASLAYQFERSGYFALDPASKGKDNLLFNRVVTLRDTWGLAANTEEVSEVQTGRRTEQKSTNEEVSVEVEDVRRIAFRAATIVSVEPHPEADSLLICKVDCGDGEEAGPRTVVAGLAGKIPAEELIGRRVVAVTNLKPAKMRGIESFAMLLAALDRSEEGKVELLQIAESVPNGELVSFEGKSASHPDEMLKSKGALKAWERVKASLIANEDGDCGFVEGNTVRRMMTSAGPVRTPTLRSAIVQ